MKTVFEPFLDHLVQHLQEGVCFIDRQQQFTLWNHVAVQLTGIAEKEVLGTRCCESVLSRSLPPSATGATAPCPFDLAMENRAPVSHQLTLQHQAGHRTSINLKIIPVTDPGGLLGLIGIFSDASSRAELEATTRSMQKLLRIDPLTLLPNKKSLFDSMKGEYLRYVRYRTPFALIAISINADTRLARTGPERNALLKWLGQQLSLGFRKADTPGRLRGTVFLVLLPHANTQAAEKAAAKMLARFAAIPYPATGAPVTVCFGCASITRSDTLERLIDRAKQALRAALDQSDGSGIASL